MDWPPGSAPHLEPRGEQNSSAWTIFSTAASCSPLASARSFAASTAARATGPSRSPAISGAVMSGILPQPAHGSPGAGSAMPLPEHVVPSALAQLWRTT